MPTFDFQCTNCQFVYDDLVPFDKTGKYKKVICPECGSNKKEKLATACGFSFGNPVGTDRYMSESGGHDYRFHHNLPNVIAERQAAELAASDPNPYNQINDLDNDAAWGDKL